MLPTALKLKPKCLGTVSLNSDITIKTSILALFQVIINFSVCVVCGLCSTARTLLSLWKVWSRGQYQVGGFADPVARNDRHIPLADRE